jgi:predicted nucleic-acid-binding Zn-ribbon protein
MVFAPCDNCGRHAEKHSKGMCITCYKKLIWKPKLKICNRCKRSLPMQAKGLCPGCYNFVFHLERIKAHSYKKKFNLDLEDYKKITKSCIICGFDKVVDLHHLDENRENNSKENLVGLCPNHHKMVHDFRYRKEVRRNLKEKGLNLPQDVKLDFS